VKKKHRKLIRRYAEANGTKPLEKLIGMDWGLSATLREIRELPETEERKAA